MIFGQFVHTDVFNIALKRKHPISNNRNQQKQLDDQYPARDFDLNFSVFEKINYRGGTQDGKTQQHGNERSILIEGIMNSINDANVMKVRCEQLYEFLIRPVLPIK